MEELRFHRLYFNMKKLPVIFTLLFTLITIASMSQALQTVSAVDLTKYAGKWFEIASYPQFFQKGCTCTTAEYTLTDKGYVIVENRCNKDSVNGKPIYIKGKAFVVEHSSNAKLKVQFFWPLKGKYWIIDLAEDYAYAVVSNPNKKSLWILSRTAAMDDDTYQQIVSKLKRNGFDISKIKRTPQI